jgi:hypothetical protein
MVSDGYVLTVKVPSELMDLLLQTARRDLRTPEDQALWLIRDGLFRADPGPLARTSRKDRLRAAGPLTAQLRAAFRQAGQPSHRAVARQAIARQHQISHTTLSEVMRGTHFPSWQLVEAIAAGLGTDPDRFRSAWEQALT